MFFSTVIVLKFISSLNSFSSVFSLSIKSVTIRTVEFGSKSKL